MKKGDYMQIKIYKNFSKKKNSTKQPASTAGTAVDVQLKDNTSFYAPVFLLTSPDPDTNYCYAWTNYYYVTDIVFISGNLYELHCHIDVMASWRTAIGNSTQYVLRSSATYDTWIMDTLYPTTAGVTYSNVTTTNPLMVDRIGNGTYIVGIINKDTAKGIGAVRYYVMTQAGFDYFMQVMLNTEPSETIYGAWSDVSTNTMKAIFNPMQYVVSCHWIPWRVNPPTAGDGRTIDKLSFGWWDMDNIPANSIWVTSPLATYANHYISFTNLPVHPQQSRGKYLNSAPYSRYSLTIEPFGNIVLDGTLMAKATAIYCNIKTDVFTGASYMDITLGYGEERSGIIRRCYATVGADVQLAQISRNELNTVVEAVNTGAAAVGAIADVKQAFSLGGIAKGLTGFGESPAKNIANDVAGVVSGIASTIESRAPQMESRGSNSSWLTSIGANPVATLHCEFFEVVDDDNAHRGKPLCSDVQINTIPGYILCADVEADFPGTEVEREEIKAIMEGGFYYE